VGETDYHWVLDWVGHEEHEEHEEHDEHGRGTIEHGLLQRGRLVGWLSWHSRIASHRINTRWLTHSPA
jgi:hypothetical protein